MTQRNFSHGQHVGTTAYFYTRDHLGSIREMFTGGGTVVARYDYDPYGRSTTVLGTTPTDFNFTGLYRHSKSNLDLAVYRAYDPDLGRWLNRDPLKNAEISQGPSLYAYGRNNPANKVDRLGLYVPPPGPIPPWLLPVLGAAIGLEIGNIPAVRNWVENVSYNLFFRPPEVPLPNKTRSQCDTGRRRTCTYSCHTREGSIQTQTEVFPGQFGNQCPKLQTVDPDTGQTVDCDVISGPE